MVQARDSDLSIFCNCLDRFLQPRLRASLCRNLPSPRSVCGGRKTSTFHRAHRSFFFFFLGEVVGICCAAGESFQVLWRVEGFGNEMGGGGKGDASSGHIATGLLDPRSGAHFVSLTLFLISNCEFVQMEAQLWCECTGWSLQSNRNRSKPCFALPFCVPLSPGEPAHRAGIFRKLERALKMVLQ